MEVDGPSEDMRDQFIRIAEIEFNALTPTKITWKGETKEVGSFFRKGDRKWDSLGRCAKVPCLRDDLLMHSSISDRIFTGPDGVDYKWVVGNKVTAPAVSFAVAFQI